MGAAPGQWSATIKLGRGATIDPIRGDILPGDWCDIAIVRNGIRFPLCRGRCHAPRQRKYSAGGATARTITLTGTDHGGLFTAKTSWNNLFVQTIQQLVEGLNTSRVGGRVGGTPSELFELLIFAMFGEATSTTHSAWQLPPELTKLTGADRFGQLISVVQDGPTRGELYNELNFWTQAGQDLHSTLSQWCNPLLNEMFYDLNPLEDGGGFDVQATIRERPFVNVDDLDESPWFDLEEVRIPTWLLSDDDLGRSDAERFSVFDIVAEMGLGGQQEQTALAAPLWSESVMQKHGVMPFLERTNFIAVGGGGQGGWEEERKRWMDLIGSWYAPNPYWLSGTLTFPVALPECRIGKKIRLDSGHPRTSISAYIEGVDIAYEFGTRASRSSSQIMVTRGYEGEEIDRIDLVKSTFEQYKGEF
jgi:hypothetical protein